MEVLMSAAKALLDAVGVLAKFKDAERAKLVEYLQGCVAVLDKIRALLGEKDNPEPNINAIFDLCSELHERGRQLRQIAKGRVSSPEVERLGTLLERGVYARQLASSSGNDRDIGMKALAETAGSLRAVVAAIKAR